MKMTNTAQLQSIIAFVGSGINAREKRLSRTSIQTLSVRVQANRHASIDHYCSHFSSLDTEVAVAFHLLQPHSKILSVQIHHNEETPSSDIDGTIPQTSPETILAGVEVAVLAGAKLIFLLACTFDMQNSLLLRECCSRVAQSGCVLLTISQDQQSYPGMFPEFFCISPYPISIDPAYFSSDGSSLTNIFYTDPNFFPNNSIQRQIFFIADAKQQNSFVEHIARVLSFVYHKIVQMNHSSDDNSMSVQALLESQFYLPLPLNHHVQSS